MKSFKNINNIQNPKNIKKTNNFLLKNLLDRTKINPEVFNYFSKSIKRSNSFSSIEPIINNKKLNSHNINNFLPKNKQKSKINKKTLILDLDETLVHSCITNDLIINSNNNLLFKYYSIEDNSQKYIKVIIRPYLKEFFLAISQKFEIVIFTASVKNYASPLIDIIDINKICKHRLFRDDCLLINGTFIKNLDLLNKNLKNVIIIDNSSKSFLLHPENGIKSKSFINDLNDKELLYLIPILNFLSEVDDVRKYINKIRELNVESFKNYEMIINYFKKENNKIVLNKRNENYFSNKIFKKFLSDDNYFMNDYNFINKGYQNEKKINLNLKKVKNNQKIKKNIDNKNIDKKYKINSFIINNNSNNNNYFSKQFFKFKINYSLDKNKKLHCNNSFNSSLNIKLNKYKINEHTNLNLVKNYSYNEEILKKNKIKSKIKLKSDYKSQNQNKIFIKPLKFKNKNVNNFYKFSHYKSNIQINCNYKI